MKRLFRLESVILPILEQNERARGDDMYLYSEYIKSQFLYSNAYNFYNIFNDEKYRKEFNIKTFQAVSRCRRKIQEKRPDLSADAKKQDAREAETTKYRNYAIVKSPKVKSLK